jgi:hypothetical protein
MKSILFAAAIALVPSLAAAADTQPFDYRGSAAPMAIVDSPAAPVRAQIAPVVVIPSAMFLTKQSDYSVFVKADVPLEAHRQAMRLLWATNPELGQPLAGDI